MKKEAEAEVLPLNRLLNVIRALVDSGIVRFVADQQIIFKRDKKAGAAGISLSSGTAPQLIINAAALMLVGTDHVEPAQLGHALSQFDVCTATRHVGGDGHCAALTSSGNDAGLLLLIACIQHLMPDAMPLKPGADPFRFFHAASSHQHRTSGLVHLVYFLDERVFFFSAGVDCLV